MFKSWTVEYSVAQACEPDQRQRGCRIDNGACQCGYGCKSDYRYTSRPDCMDALKVIGCHRIIRSEKRVVSFQTCQSIPDFQSLCSYMMYVNTNIKYIGRVA